MTTPIDLNARLNRLGFTPEDLAANRADLLTERQCVEVAYRQKIYVRNGRIMLLILWSIFAVLIVPLLLGSKDIDTFNAELPSAGLALLLVSGLAGFAFIWGSGSARDLISGKISHAEGRAKVRIRTPGGCYKDYPRCEVKLGRRTFLLADRDQFNAFVDGTPYRVFYVRNVPLHVILSAEVI